MIKDTPWGKIETDVTKYPHPPNTGVNLLARQFFFLMKPADILKSPILMKSFFDAYGVIAESVLKTFGCVPENNDLTKIWTPEQKIYFNADGTQAFYSVPELLEMTENELKAAGYDPNNILQIYVYLWYFPAQIPNT